MEAAFPPLIIYKTFNCPAEILFDAWTEHDLMRKWLFTGETSSIANIDSRLETGGGFAILEKEADAGEFIGHYGIYG